MAIERPLENSLDGFRVVAVDDESDSVELIAAVLRMCGAFVRTAVSASEALDVVAGWLPDVLLSDLEMPVESGYELIARLRHHPGRLGRLPVIAVSAHTLDRAQALAAGFTAFVPKPVNLTELVTAVRGSTPGPPQHHVH